MIYTTYFAKLKSLPETIIPISICGKAPDFYNGLQYKKLAPKWWFFQEWKKTHDNGFYIDNFNKLVLAPLNAESVVKELTEMAGGNDIALVCYEKPGDFCHRHIVSKWLRRRGYNCVEYGV
jgi:uncharacterized protein YeaO (DUF488 family)